MFLFFQPFLCRRKMNRVSIFLTGRTFLFCFYLKTDWKELVSNSCQKPAFDTCQAYNIFAPKTNLLESSYPLFLASQLQVRCRSRHFRTSLEVKQNFAFQLLLCKTCAYCLVTLSLGASSSFACLVSRWQGLADDLYFWTLLSKLFTSSICGLPGDFKVSDVQQLMVVDKCESVMVSDGWWKLLTLAC